VLARLVLMRWTVPIEPATAWRHAVLLGLVLMTTAASAQSSSRAATVELGFEGAVVAEAWNPLRVTLRDVGRVSLEIAIDRGTLRDGERWAVYRIELPGGSGLSLFEDTLFVPVWRSLHWTVRSDGLLVASGSVPRTQADRRRVDVIVGEPGPAARAALGTARSVDVTAERLPLRSAAYDGVQRVVVATPSVRPEALVAAAAAGATVVLLPAARHAEDVAALLPAGVLVQRLGSGVIAAGGAADSLTAGGAAAPHVDHAALVSAFAASERLQPPRPRPVMPVALAAAGYALLVLVVIRFGGLPGLLAAAVLVAAASTAAWVPLRPTTSSIDATRDLVIGGAGIGQRWRLHERLTLPEQTMTFPVGGWPLSDADARLSADRVEVDLGRWRSATVLERPRTVDLPLWQGVDGRWRYDGAATLELLVLPGAEPRRDVAPGELEREHGVAAGPLPPVAQALLALVPEGAALAFDGQAWLIALPAIDGIEASR